MAKILLGVFAPEIRGHAGGTVFSKNTFANYIRNKVTPVNPSTVAQALVRSRFTGLSQDWRGLTQAQRDAWNQGAQAFAHTNIFGNNVPLTGFNLFKQLNQNLLAAGAAQIDDIPTVSDVFAFTSQSLSADTTGGTIDLTFAPAIPVGTSVIVYATPGVSAGINFVKSEFRQIVVLGSGNASPFDATAVYTAVFGALPTVGQKVFFETRPILDSSGQSGQRLKSFDIAF